MKPANIRKTNSEVEVLLNMGRKDEIDEVMSETLRIANLKYIYDMLLELRTIAKATDEEALVYYLEMSAMEASDASDAIRMKQDLDAENDVSQS